uniref:Uncharacterized protein n=1 Tax=Octopus bimaculoides TaxID=37653 RepID=A0A0L8GVL8_OCTBM
MVRNSSRTIGTWQSTAVNLELCERVSCVLGIYTYTHITLFLNSKMCLWWKCVI